MPLMRRSTSIVRRVSALTLITISILFSHAPAHPEARGTDISLLKQSGRETAQDAPRRVLAEAEQLVQSGDTEGAIRVLKTLAESGKAPVEVFAKLGELYGGKRDYEAAADAYREAIKLAGGEEPFR